MQIVYSTDIGFK